MNNLNEYVTKLLSDAILTKAIDLTLAELTENIAKINDVATSSTFISNSSLNDTLTMLYKETHLCGEMKSNNNYDVPMSNYLSDIFHRNLQDVIRSVARGSLYDENMGS